MLDISYISDTSETWDISEIDTDSIIIGVSFLIVVNCRTEGISLEFCEKWWH